MIKTISEQYRKKSEKSTVSDLNWRNTMSDNMLEIANQVEHILDLVLDASNGDTIVFTSEARENIHEFSNQARETKIYKDCMLTGKNFVNGMTAEDAFAHMCDKITDAQTSFHMAMVPIIMFPLIDDILQEENSNG